MAMKSYRVMREHQGDKDYVRGDVRKANDGDVKHLVDLGVLKLLGDAPKPRPKKTGGQKAAAPLANKRAPALANKSIVAGGD